MTVIPFKTILLCLVSSIGFTACSTLSSQTEQPLQQLQLVQNIDALPDTKTNAASLIDILPHLKEGDSYC